MRRPLSPGAAAAAAAALLLDAASAATMPTLRRQWLTAEAAQHLSGHAQRIAKVIAKLKAEHPDTTADLACAHFTLAPSNFKVWLGQANNAQALREQLVMFQSAEKQSTGDQDQTAQTAMLAELLLKHGLGALGVHAISKTKSLAGVTVHLVCMPDDRHMWLCFDPYTEALKAEIVQAKPAKVVMLNSCFVGPKADELLSNLQLELAGLDIGLTVI
jgi:adenine-specific DNA-methyltransferase